ncbi:MAG: hypothetical protein P8X61_13780, partial [Limibacillus sp.]
LNFSKHLADLVGRPGTEDQLPGLVRLHLDRLAQLQQILIIGGRQVFVLRHMSDKAGERPAANGNPPASF